MGNKKKITFWEAIEYLDLVEWLGGSLVIFFPCIFILFCIITKLIPTTYQLIVMTIVSFILNLIAQALIIKHVHNSPKACPTEKN